MTVPASPAPSEIADALWHYHAGPSPAAVSDDLAALADQFIQLKRHLGHRYHASGASVRHFIRFFHERGVRRAAELTPEAVSAWAASRAHLHSLTWMREVSAVSVFLDHLKALGQIANNPCTVLRRRIHSNFRPYIFTPDELRRIFALADSSGPARPRARVYLVIYACGLRVSEAVRLCCRDFDAAQGTLFIRDSKFRKDRLLPVSPRLVDRLRQYRSEGRAEALPHARFFVNPHADGRPYTSTLLSHHFRLDLLHLGLYQPTRETDGVRQGSPRLHSLRHTFAVNRLLRWYRQGVDVQAKLSLLSTYLGHSHVDHTQVYLKITGLLLREANHRFAGRWEKEVPLSP